MIREYLQTLRAAGAAMRAGGIAMRCGYERSLPVETKRNTPPLPPIYGGFKQDAAKLAGDWRKVGNDIRQAMQKIGANNESKK